MKGDWLVWHQIAAILHMPVRELQEVLTFTDFLDWCAYVEHENTWRAKQEYYLAQIACEVCKGRILHPEKLRVKDFYCSVPQRALSKEAAEKMALSKNAWAAACNLKLN